MCYPLPEYELDTQCRYIVHVHVGYTVPICQLSKWYRCTGPSILTAVDN